MKPRPVLLLLLGLLLILATSAPAASPPDVPVAAIGSTLRQYRHLVTHRELDLDNLQQLSCSHGQYLSRGVLDMIILQKALEAGGWPGKIHFTQLPNGERMRYEIAAGKVMCSATVMWDSHFDSTTRKSEPTIAKGGYTKGIYLARDVMRRNRINNPEDLVRVGAVGCTVRSWKVDIAALEKLTSRPLRLIPRKDLLFRLLAFSDKPIYYSLLEFSGRDDLSISETLAGQEIIYLPLPGVKVALDGSMHYMVSRKFPGSQTFFKALNTGLDRLKKEGLIRRLYTLGGIYNTRVTDWQTLTSLSPANTVRQAPVDR